MFGRQLAFSIETKPKTKTAPEDPSVDPRPSVAVEVTDGIDRVIRTVIQGIVVYMAADTVRKVIIKSTKEG